MEKEKAKQIQLENNKLYIVKDGKLRSFEGPKSGFGKQEVTWHNGKVTFVETQTSEKID